MNKISIKLYQTKFKSDDTKTIQIIILIIGHTKITIKNQFHPEALAIKYHQKTYNSCCLSSLASAFQCNGENRDVPALLNIIEESLTLQT